MLAVRVKPELVLLVAAELAFPANEGREPGDEDEPAFSVEVDDGRIGTYADGGSNIGLNSYIAEASIPYCL